ncbi:hypothetical protein O181_086553 [Austropuccinia psidii MF-1]|uniref:Uncharacterized protein n=1 Tax=Austropuccinia psidii MF-1 TaxID=1389203 RepID=A0A9Q3FZG7_9BASI|nr:hypothetical protein [Austropuccinia psidii MF-1]
METASTVTSIIPASTANSDYNSTAIISQNNQPEPVTSEFINLYIDNTLHKAKNSPNNQEPAKNPQAALKKGHRSDYGRRQSVTEEQGLANECQTDKLCHPAADNTVLPSNRAATASRSLSGHLKSQPEGIQQLIAAQRVPEPCLFVEKLQEFLPDCEEIPCPSQHLQVTQCIASIDGKEKHDAFSSRMEAKQPSTTQASAKNIPSSQQMQFQHEKAATS